MNPARITGRVTFWIGAVLLAGALALLVKSQTGSGDTGWEDLASFAGALILATACGVFFGASLWLSSRSGEPYPPAWQQVVAVAGTVIAFLAALSVGAIAMEAPNLPLLGFVGLVLIVTGGGFYGAARMWRTK